jgi:phage head maturation protease
MGRDVVTSIDRGDLTGSSFAFLIRKQTWLEGGNEDIRQVDDVELVDVGPVTYPAYEGTSTGLRSEGNLDEVVKEWESRKRERKEALTQAAHEHESFLLRARLAGL